MEKNMNTRKVYGQWKKTRSSWIMSELMARATGTASPRKLGSRDVGKAVG